MINAVYLKLSQSNLTNFEECLNASKNGRLYREGMNSFVIGTKSLGQLQNCNFDLMAISKSAIRRIFS